MGQAKVHVPAIWLFVILYFFLSYGIYFTYINVCSLFVSCGAKPVQLMYVQIFTSSKKMLVCACNGQKWLLNHTECKELTFCERKV